MSLMYGYQNVIHIIIYRKKLKFKNYQAQKNLREEKIREKELEKLKKAFIKNHKHFRIRKL